MAEVFSTTLKSIGVVGAGQMGTGITLVCALAGFTVTLVDCSLEMIEKSEKSLNALLDRSVEKGKLSASEKLKALSLIKLSQSSSDLVASDYVIEAVKEDFKIKEQLFKELDTITPAHAILASNTSSISITKIAAVTARPHQVIGMHFMNPVPVMKLTEIIRGIQTSDQTLAITKALAAKLDKFAVVAPDAPGFIVNRVLVPMVNEAIFLIQQGISPEDIDAAMKLGTNQPMGPIMLADFVGLDTLLSILQIMHQELGEDKYRPCPLLVKYVEAGWLGKKAKRGFYSYD